MPHCMCYSHFSTDLFSPTCLDQLQTGVNINLLHIFAKSCFFDIVVCSGTFTSYSLNYNHQNSDHSTKHCPMVCANPITVIMIFHHLPTMFTLQKSLIKPFCIIEIAPLSMDPNIRKSRSVVDRCVSSIDYATFIHLGT